MRHRHPGGAVVDQRGMALPLALLVLTLLTSLTLAFIGMSATEPLIAKNLERGGRALALAEAGIERAIWSLANSGVAIYGLANPLPNPIPAPFNGQSLVAFGGADGAFTINVAAGVGPTDRTLTARGYVVRNGVAVPANPAALAQSDIAAERTIQLRVTATSNGPVGGPAAPNNVTLPGALTVAGTVQLTGNSLVNGNDSAPGTPNTCAGKAGVTIRQQTKLADNTLVTNTIDISGSGSAVGTPAQQTIAGDQTNSDFQNYLFSAAQLAALKALAQSQGTYIQPTSSDQFNLTLVNGLMFVDTVNGQAIGPSPQASQLASVRITGGSNSGWLIVMGSIRIDGDVTYHGLVYAHNDISYRGTGTGGIYGGMVSANTVDSVATVVDTDPSGNSKVYFDCTAIANGGGSFGSGIQDTLNSSLGSTITVIAGSWQEISN